MSGSIGGSRIKRAEVEPTLALYINKVLNGFPGFVSAQITGSYNAGTRTDHGDIDIAVHINGNDLKKVKKDFNLIEAYDMTLEATVTKLMYLMKKFGKDYKSIREYFYKPINYDIAKPEIGS